MRILVLDNYDSFTYNLVYIVRKLGYNDQMDIYRNDKISLDAVDQYDKILLSPGPGIPDEAGIMKELIQRYAPSKSILGVCLGHQAIAEVFGAKLFNMSTVLHGHADEIIVKDRTESIFEGVPDKFAIGHYHSWSVEPDSINGALAVTAVDQNALIMGIKHTTYDVRGLQFHPESVLTKNGVQIIDNWLKA
ncbi:MAG: aminodeoxychorismate/anthranilate synthase component II [Bacteroidota bacterium]